MQVQPSIIRPKDPRCLLQRGMSERAIHTSAVPYTFPLPLILSSPGAQSKSKNTQVHLDTHAHAHLHMYTESLITSLSHLYFVFLSGTFQGPSSQLLQRLLHNTFLQITVNRHILLANNRLQYV